MSVQDHPLQTHMAREIRDIPDSVQRLLDGSSGDIAAAGAQLRQLDPPMVTTIARGSSDHAAFYLKYAIELLAGVPVASSGPSIASIYSGRLKLKGMAAIAISQSGQSPDIVAMAESAGNEGALTLSITNGDYSPLAGACDLPIDIRAGLEKSVAATKTFVSSVVAGLALLADWQEDAPLQNAVRQLPEQLAKAISCDWSELKAALAGRSSAFVLGRGPSLAIASEAALKFKETSQLHAEAYSSAEVLHGPMSIIGAGFPVLALASRDASQQSIVANCEKLAGQGANVFVTSDLVRDAHVLPFASTGHPLTDPLALIVSFYHFVEQFSRQCGLNPDVPRHLNKVTETL